MESEEDTEKNDGLKYEFPMFATMLKNKNKGFLIYAKYHIHGKYRYLVMNIIKGFVFEVLMNYSTKEELMINLDLKYPGMHLAPLKYDKVSKSKKYDIDALIDIYDLKDVHMIKMTG